MTAPDPNAVCNIDEFFYKDNYVKFGPWDNFVAGFIAVFSNHISPDVINEIGDFLFFEGLFSNAAFDLLTSQPTFLIFFWLGVILSAISITGAVLLLIPNTRQWSTKNVSSKTMNLVGIILAIVSFCFIAVGIGLYSIPPLVSDNSMTDAQISNVKTNLDTFMKSKSENDCFTVNTFAPIINQTTMLTDTVVDNFHKHTGLQDASQIDYNELGQQLLGNASQVKDIIADLKNAAKLPKIANDPSALDQVNNAIKEYQSISDLLNPGNLPAGYKAASAASDNIARVYSAVNDTVGAADTAMEMTKSLIATATDNIHMGMKQMEETFGDQFRMPITLLVFIFLVVALIAAAAAITCSTIFMARKTLTPSRGVAHGMYILAFIVLVLTSFVFGLTIFVMIMGYSVQASCQPFFYDSNLKGLQTMAPRLPHFVIPTMEAFIYVNTSFTYVMRTCKNAHVDIEKPSTFFSAAVGWDTGALDEYKMQDAMNIDAVFSQFKGNLDSTVIRSISSEDYLYISNSINEIATTPNLQSAHEQAPDAINEIMDKAAQFEKDVQPMLDECYAALDDTLDFIDQFDIKNKIDDEMRKALPRHRECNARWRNKTLRQSNFLYYDSESCGNLYRSWADAGDLGCRETNIIWDGQGMWPASGLAALFFLPLALSLVCIANAYRHGKTEIPAPVDSHSTKVQAPAQPVIASATHHQQPAPHSAQAPPAVPTRSASRDPWQPSVYVRDVYPSFQPPFVDPLAAPSPPAPHRRVVGSSTIGQYPPQF